MSNFKSKWIRIVLAAGLAALLVGGAVGQAAAFDFRSGATIIIQSNEVIDDDAFLAAQKVVVDGTVNGDLFAAGSEIEINGTVNGSLFAAGQTIIINGQVSGGAYTSGMSVTYKPQAAIGRNALFGGFGLETQSGSAIGRDLVAGGYQAVLAGEVGRDLRFGGSALELNGKIGGDVTAEVEAQGSQADVMPFRFFAGMPNPVPPGLRIAEQATIGGKLTYTSPEDQSGAIQSKPEGGVVYQTPQPTEEPTPRPQVGVGFNILGWIFDRIRDFVTLMLLGAVVVWKLPSLLNSVIDRARARPLPSAGWGVVVIVVGYVGAAIVGILIFILGLLFGIVTLGGLSQTVFGVGFSSLSLVFTVFTLLVSYGSKLVVSYLVGKLIWRGLSPQNAENPWMPLVIGVSLYVLVSAIPVLGWLIAIAVTLVGIGAMWLLFREWRRPAPAAAPALAAA